MSGWLNILEENRRIVVKRIPISRMDCPTCIPFLEKEVEKIKGVKEAKGSYMTRTLRVSYDPKVVNIEEIEKAIEGAGYRVAYKKYPDIMSKMRGFLKKTGTGSVRTLDDGSFDETIKTSKRVAVVFSSETCPTCRALRGVYDKAAERLKDVKIYEMDVASTKIWHRYDILSIPTILVFENGEVVKRIIPSMSEEELIKILVD
ncbi:cation transporter [Candidatus Bathyarchaeota archaeon]|nr:cation transporter [Candidatus Bathyarchaeota archaeon]MBS7630764.1 cation transporter [Candidatus Bathyarchaeota archaeon]